MTRWEHARLYYAIAVEGAANVLEFSHRPPVAPLEETLWTMLQQLGDDGWELVSTQQLEHALVLWLKRPWDEHSLETT